MSFLIPALLLMLCCSCAASQVGPRVRAAQDQAAHAGVRRPLWTGRRGALARVSVSPPRASWRVSFAVGHAADLGPRFQAAAARQGGFRPPTLTSLTRPLRSGQVAGVKAAGAAKPLVAFTPTGTPACSLARQFSCLHFRSRSASDGQGCGHPVLGEGHGLRLRRRRCHRNRCH